VEVQFRELNEAFETGITVRKFSASLTLQNEVGSKEFAVLVGCKIEPNLGNYSIASAGVVAEFRGKQLFEGHKKGYHLDKQPATDRRLYR
jgi:hypothetical protein